MEEVMMQSKIIIESSSKNVLASFVRECTRGCGLKETRTSNALRQIALSSFQVNENKQDTSCYTRDRRIVSCSLSSRTGKSGVTTS